MNETSECNECKKQFNHFESLFLDTCDPCLEKLEGKTIAELKKEYAEDE